MQREGETVSENNKVKEGRQRDEGEVRKGNTGITKQLSLRPANTWTEDSLDSENNSPKEPKNLGRPETVKEVETKPPEKSEELTESRTMVTRSGCLTDPLERAMQQLAESLEDVETGGEAGAVLSSLVLVSP